ncbi:unnamed protein product, partial [Mesorhabditis spiculigera]
MQDVREDLPSTFNRMLSQEFVWRDASGNESPVSNYTFVLLHTPDRPSFPQALAGRPVKFGANENYTLFLRAVNNAVDATNWTTWASEFTKNRIASGVTSNYQSLLMESFPVGKTYVAAELRDDLCLQNTTIQSEGAAMSQGVNLCSTHLYVSQDFQNIPSLFMIYPQIGQFFSNGGGTWPGCCTHMNGKRTCLCGVWSGPPDL